MYDQEFSVTGTGVRTGDYAEVLETLENNFYDTRDLQVVDVMLPDGTREQQYQIEGDITISVEEIEKLPNLKKEGDTEKHYYRNDLVSPKTQTITIGGRSGSANYALNSRQMQGLRKAVANFNDLNLSIRFSLSFDSNWYTLYQNQIVVHNDPDNPNFGGSAKWPSSNGQPGRSILIFGSENLTPEQIERIFTHEIGHCIGLRHVDWDTKQSCTGTTEADSSSGGVNEVPGTISGFDASSVMVSCGNSRTSGNFSWDDKKALRYLYPRSTHTF